VTGLADGRFVISWYDQGPDNNLRTDIKAQIFAASGAKIGGEFTVNTVTAGAQNSPVVSVLPGGGFVVAWNDNGFGGTDNPPIKAQVYDAAGGKVGVELTVTVSTTLYDDEYSVATLENGNFVVSWTDADSTFSVVNVKAQIFRPDGTKVGDEFLVSDLTSRDSKIDALASGGFVATWSSSVGISGQIFDSNGSKIGSAFQIDTFTAGRSADAVVTALDDGRFAVAWVDNITDYGWSEGDIMVMRTCSPLTLIPVCCVSRAPPISTRPAISTRTMSTRALHGLC